MNVENRVGKVEEAIGIMKDLLINHSERLEGYFNALNRERRERNDAFDRERQERNDAFDRERQEREESRRDFEFKLNALIDSQIRTEAELIEVKESIIKLQQASESQLQRIENIESK